MVMQAHQVDQHNLVWTSMEIYADLGQSFHSWIGKNRLQHESHLMSKVERLIIVTCQYLIPHMAC